MKTLIFNAGVFEMFERISNGWELARESWEVLKCDKELLLFPLVSGIACMLVLVSFAIPMWATGLVGEMEPGGQGEKKLTQQVIGYGVLFAFYFVNYFVIVFFNSALVACALIRFRGGDPTISDGLAAAWERLPQIAAWALLAATVGVLLKMIESRSEKVGQIVASLLGMAWSIVTYFVVPVIVVEKTGPMQATKRSAQVMKSTWGESLAANFGIGMIVFLAMLVAIVPIVMGVVAIGSDYVPLGIVGIVLGVIAIITVSLISSALNSIIIAALYLYAVEGTIPGQFDDRLLRNAFAAKR